MEKKKYLVEDISYPQRCYLELSDSEVGVIKFLIKEGFLPSDMSIICIDDTSFIKFE